MYRIKSYSWNLTLFLFLLNFLLLASNANAGRWNSPRDYEPVVLQGSAIPQMIGAPISELFVYAYNAEGNQWYQIPFQFDEKDDSTHFWDIGKNGLLDLNDELVFMAKDMGDSAPAESWIDDEVSRQYDRVEIELTDTVDNNKKAWVYIYRSATLLLDPDLEDYISYIPNPESPSADTVKALSYVEGHNTGGIPDYWVIPTSFGGNGLDIMDRQKIRINLVAEIIPGFYFPLTVTEELLMVFPPTVMYKDGLIRVLREAQWTVEMQNMDPVTFELPLQYYPYSIGSGGVSGKMKAKDQVSLIRQSFDLNVNAVGMTFYNPYNPSGLLVDGSPDTYDNTLNQEAVNWYMITGTQGTYALLFMISPLGESQSIYYKDNSSTDDNDTGDKMSYGDSGLLITGTAIEGNISFSYQQYFLGPNQEYGMGDTLALNFENPLQLNTNSSNFVPVELTAFSAKVTAENSVELNWTTATESNNYGFEIQRKSDGDENWQAIAFINGYGTTMAQQNYSYIDDDITEGHYYYRLKQVDFDGSFEYSASVEVFIDVHLSFKLSQNYPNPFNPETQINFELPMNGRINASIFNIYGEQVTILYDGKMEAGQKRLTWNGKNSIGNDVSGGTYFLRLTYDPDEGERQVVSMRMTFLK